MYYVFVFSNFFKGNLSILFFLFGHNNQKSFIIIWLLPDNKRWNNAFYSLPDFKLMKNWPIRSCYFMTKRQQPAILPAKNKCNLMKQSCPWRIKLAWIYDAVFACMNVAERFQMQSDRPMQGVLWVLVILGSTVYILDSRKSGSTCYTVHTPLLPFRIIKRKQITRPWYFFDWWIFQRDNCINNNNKLLKYRYTLFQQPKMHNAEAKYMSLEGVFWFAGSISENERP